METMAPTAAIFLDLSKAFERINLRWILRILFIKGAPGWVIAFARNFLFGRKIRHKIQNRLMPSRSVHSGVDMGRSSSVFFFCLAMDPIFTYLNAIPGVIQVEGYVDDTSITGAITDDLTWLRKALRAIEQWNTAGIQMDPHKCWRVGLPLSISIPSHQVLPISDFTTHSALLPAEGFATFADALHHLIRLSPTCTSNSIIVERSGSIVLLTPSALQQELQGRGGLLFKLAVPKCECRAKTIFMINDHISPKQLQQFDFVGMGLQCLTHSAINLGLPVHTGWNLDQEGSLQYQVANISLKQNLRKQTQKFQARLAAPSQTVLSIRLRITYFNAFCLSRLYYVQSIQFYAKEQLTPLYQKMSSFVLQRKWFPAKLLPGLCRWLKIGPLLDP